MSHVIVVSAPSGAGKTTLLKLLIARQSAIRFSVSHTTRPRRTGEVDGADYHFVTLEAFAKDVAGGRFLEWAEVYGNRYGTHRAELERAVTDGVDLILDIDLQGARAVRAALPEACLILVAPPSWAELERRLRTRGTDSEEVIARRLAQAREQVAAHQLYDYLVLNDDLEQAYQRLAAILQAERQRIRPGNEVLRRLLAES